jgi:hypothetical protein
MAFLLDCRAGNVEWLIYIEASTLTTLLCRMPWKASFVLPICRAESLQSSITRGSFLVSVNSLLGRAIEIAQCGMQTGEALVASCCEFPKANLVLTNAGVGYGLQMSGKKMKFSCRELD